MMNCSFSTSVSCLICSVFNIELYLSCSHGVMKLTYRHLKKIHVCTGIIFENLASVSETNECKCS